MARDFRIEGPCLAFVRGGAHMSGRAVGATSELGISADSVRVEPRFRYRDISCDDFGGDIPAEVQWQLSDALIKMTLVHFDHNVLEVVIGESMGGGAINWGVTVESTINNAVFGPDLLLNSKSATTGMVAPAGKLMGAGLPMFASGNHLMSMVLTAPYTGYPWRFRSCYLAERPVIYPTGTKYSQVELTWRAIPYYPIYVSGLDNSAATTVGPPYSRPPAVDTRFSIEIDPPPDEFQEGFDPDADPNQYFLTREPLSSGLALWDRLVLG